MTPADCPTLDALAAFAAGRQVPGVGAHVDGCSTCSRRVLAVRQAMRTSVDAETIATAAEEVETLVSELLSVSPRDRMRVATGERFGRAGVARRFCELAVAEWERDLNLAFQHIHVATLIADVLARRAASVGELEFEAWKNRSTIHRERGETDSARAALLRAANAIQRCGDREMKRAILWYADAAICASRDVWQPDQAFALLARCEPVFEHREPARHRAARTLRGIVHLHGGDYAAALEAFASVADETDADDRAARADARRNVANALIRLGRVEEAEDVLRDVRAIDVELGRVLQIIRDDGLAALASEARGDYERACEGYAAAQRRFASAGEIESSLLMGKSRALALVALDRPGDAVAVLRDLVALNIADRSERRRFTSEALSYLRHLAEHQQLTADVAANVGTYIDRIHVQRPIPFTPPMSPLTM